MLRYRLPCGLALILITLGLLFACQRGAAVDPTLQGLSLAELESRQAQELADLKSAALAEAGPLIAEMEASLRAAPIDSPPDIGRYKRGMAAVRKKYEKQADAVEAKYEPYIKTARARLGVR